MRWVGAACVAAVGARSSNRPTSRSGQRISRSTSVREVTEPADLLRVHDAVMTPFSDGRDRLYLWLGSTDDVRDEGLLPRDGRRTSSDERAFEL